MDEQRFDQVTHTLAAPATRRRALLGALGLGAAGIAAAFRARGGAVAVGQPVCQAEGAACTIWVGCCGDLTCVGTAMNPNNGVCVAGVPTRAAPPPNGSQSRTGSNRKVRASSTADTNQGSSTTRPKATSTSPSTATRKPGKTPRPTATSKPSKTPRPTRVPREEEEEAISITLKCNGDPEVIRIKNNTGRSIKIRSLRTLGTPPEPLQAGTDPWDFTPNPTNPNTRYQEVKPGKTLIFVSGQKAEDSGDRNLLAGVKIFSKARKEGVSVETVKDGTFRSFCDGRLN